MTARALVRLEEPETYHLRALWRVVSVCLDQDIVTLLEDHLRWRADRQRIRLVRCGVNQLCGAHVTLDASGLEIVTT